MSLEEFMGHWNDAEPNADIDEIYFTFEAFDEDEDGYLNKRELR